MNTFDFDGDDLFGDFGGGAEHPVPMEVEGPAPEPCYKVSFSVLLVRAT